MKFKILVSDRADRNQLEDKQFGNVFDKIVKYCSSFSTFFLNLNWKSALKLK